MRRFAAVVLITASIMAACSKPDASAMYAKGNEYLDKKMVAEAIVQYRLAIQADPKRGDVRMKLTEAFLQQRDLRSAFREAIVAADLLPGDITAQLQAGNFLLAAKSFEDANARADKALALDAKNPDALVLKGNAQAGLDNLDNALNEYQEALALNPSSDQIYANIGAVQALRGQTKEAEATFRKAVDVAPKAVSARMALANFLWASRRPLEAEAELKGALALDPANFIANRSLGGFYMATNRSAEAEPYFKAMAAAANNDAAQLALADYYLIVRRVNEAKAILTPLSQKPDSFGPASLRLAAIEASQNNRGVAATIVRGVLDKTPKYSPARVFELRLLALDKKHDEAMAAAASLIKDEPNSGAAAEAHFLVGGIEANRDRTDEAVKAFEEALRLEPRSLTVVLALAELNLRIGNPDKAETYARQFLATMPKNPFARAVIVRAYLMRNDLTKAAQELASLEKEFPNSIPVQNLVAARHLTAGKTEAARAIYAKILLNSPGNLEAMAGLVTIDLEAGRKTEAVDRVEAALKRMAPTAELYELAARANVAAGNFARTEELLKLAIEREPARLTAYGLLGQLYIGQKRLADARDQYRDLVQRNPRSVAANTMLAMVLEAQNDLPAAEAQYLKTLEVDREAAVAANNLAWIYVSSNRNLDMALELAQRALKRLPEQPNVNDTAGWIYYQKKMIPQAIRCLEISVKGSPTDPSAHYHLGMAYLQGAAMDKAKASLQKALTLSQNFDGADEARKALATLGR